MDDTGKLLIPHVRMFWYNCHVKFIGSACQVVQLEFWKFALLLRSTL